MKNLIILAVLIGLVWLVLIAFMIGGSIVTFGEWGNFAIIHGFSWVSAFLLTQISISLYKEIQEERHYDD